MDSKNETSKIDWDNDPDAISKFINSSGYYPHVLDLHAFGNTFKPIKGFDIKDSYVEQPKNNE